MFASNWIFCKYNSEHIRESIIHLQTYYLNWIKLWNPIEERNTSRTKMSLFLCLSFFHPSKAKCIFHPSQVKQRLNWKYFLFFCCKIRVQVTPWLRKSIFSPFCLVLVIFNYRRFSHLRCYNLQRKEWEPAMDSLPWQGPCTMTGEEASRHSIDPG